jgi:hypothetical protein
MSNNLRKKLETGDISESDVIRIHYSKNNWPRPSISIQLVVPKDTTVDQLKEILSKEVPKVERFYTEIQATYYTQIAPYVSQENTQLLGWALDTNGKKKYNGSTPISSYNIWNSPTTKISFSIKPPSPNNGNSAGRNNYYENEYGNENDYGYGYNNEYENYNQSQDEEAYGAGAGTNSRQAPPREENSKEEKCRKLLQSKGIKSRKNFLQKSLQLHPNKGGNVKQYQIISDCVDTLFKGGARKSRKTKQKKSRKQKTRKQ